MPEDDNDNSQDPAEIIKTQSERIDALVEVLAGLGFDPLELLDATSYLPLS